MHRLRRRHFVLGVTCAAALAGGGGALTPRRGTAAVVVGGGPAGAAAALALCTAEPSATVLLIERDPGQLVRAAAQGDGAFGRPPPTADAATLARAGVGVLLDEVVGIDWAAARLALFSGRSLAFDRLLLAPGTAPLPEPIPGLDAAARHDWPAAWGSPIEARRLAARLAALPERGHVVLRLPAAISHPQAALGRALALSAHLALHRPEARLTVLDEGATDRLARAFAPSPAARPRGGVVWLTAPQGASVVALEARRGRIETAAGSLRADVVNFVPPFAAGAIAQSAGLVDATGWCPCDAHGRSLRRPEVIVLGDARSGARRTVAGALESARTLHAARWD